MTPDIMPSDPSSRRHALRLVLLLVAVSLGSMLTVEGMNALARQWNRTPAPPPAPARAPAPPPPAFTLHASRLHPDRLYAAALLPAGADATRARRLADFDVLLDRYQTRQQVDDNFTIRVLDNRTNTLLERFVLREARRAYEQTGEVSWKALDRQRARETERLSRKYRRLGIPRAAITIKWGRANQVREAREREALYLGYELQLARRYGLSLLATEIGTVETFNDDVLVSRVGARSRYQIMPYLLRRFGVRHYRLRTPGGHRVQVFEAHHPLLTMEPAFQIMRAYANAVGHELPGLSAYHAGPYNLFKMYRMYLSRSAGAHPDVLDAFLWGLTDGYPTVSRRTTFRSASRGYVPAVYGSMRATEALPIDLGRTLRAVLVQPAPGRSATLQALLDALSTADLAWPTAGTSAYNRFRALNPHMDLPPASDSVGVPPEGNVILAARPDAPPVRFFLPPGAPEHLAATGFDLLDPQATRSFDAHTFAPPTSAERTPWDQAYESLVESVYHFGFTEANRARLTELRDQFERLAREHPTPYRQAQLAIIRLHDEVWQSEWFTRLARAVTAHAGRQRAPVSPPDPVPPPATPQGMF